ncbi:CHAT domain-containing protein [Armillaria fumosa]|nr:CHAT domain-containing protein [Armillaria fumosa]
MSMPVQPLNKLYTLLIVRLTVTIKLRADSHPNLLPYSAIFAKCTMNGTVIQESMMIKEAESTCWDLMESIQISSEISSFKLSILSRCPGHDDRILAQTELQTASLISRLVTCDYRAYPVFTGQLDDSVLNIYIGGVIVPSELSSNPSSADGSSSFDLSTTNGQSGSFSDLIDLKNRGLQFLERFQESRREDDLHNAISALGRSVSFTSDSDPSKPAQLSNFSSAFFYRFHLFGDSRDLDQAIKLGNDAVTLADGDRDNQPTFFNNLSNYYCARFEVLGNQDDLNSAVSAAELAVSVSAEGNPRKPDFLYTLAVCLYRRFQRLGELDDVTLTIEMGRLAFSLAAEGDELKTMTLHIIANSFCQRFKYLGSSDDLEESISEVKKALDLTPEGFPQNFRMLLSLSSYLHSRFDLFDDPADLDEAIAKGTGAMNAMPSRCPEKPSALSNVSRCFFSRFKLNGDLNDLTEAISLVQDALSHSTDGHIDRPSILSNLSVYLRHRFLKTKDANDLDEAVSAGRCAVACTPDDHPNKSLVMDLMQSLQSRFEVHERVDDLEESITCGMEALSLIPDGHPNKCSILSQLGSSVAYRFDHFRNPSDADKATSFLKSAALSPTGSPLIRLDAAWKWTTLRTKVDFPSALEAIKVALSLLPLVAWTGKSIAARHRELAPGGSIAHQAASWALRLGYTDIALEWLEMGRAIVWGQLHNLRSPVDFLSDAHPDLAERLSRVAVALEKATSRDVNIEHFKELSMEEVAKEHRRLATEWDSLVERVRSLPGFEDFLRPKRLATLKNAAKLGPVVIVNASFRACDALILIPGLDDVIHIPLEDFSYEKAEILLKRLNKSLSALGVRTRASRPVYGPSDKDVFMNVLKELWSCVVKPVLDGLAFSPCDTTNPPRLWWCPTGPLSFLPIHTAGDYRTNEPGTKLSDYVVSSYTPTLTILLDKLEKTRRFKGLLAISQPNTPGLSSLPGTEGELQKIKERATKVPVKCLRGEEAIPDTVLHGMSTCNWVHVACHATQEKAKSLDSTFHLHPSAKYVDGHLPLSHIIAKSVSDADFAYLSACQTATGDESLAEESVHLAAGMLMAGYQSVVATLWSIRDADAPLVADDVYSRLFEDGEPDSGNAAVALHHAVQSLRKRVEDEPDSFVRWVPFIHVGL